MTLDVSDQVKLPKDILDPSIGIEQLLRRHPKLKPDFSAIMPEKSEEAEESEEIDEPEETSASASTTTIQDNAASGDAASPQEPPKRALPTIPSVDDTDLRRSLVFSKLILNVLGPNTQTPVITAQQYSQWLQDIQYFEQAFGFAPGGLLMGQGSSKGTQRGGQARGGPGQGQTVTGQQLVGGQQGSLDPGHPGFEISEEQLREGLSLLESGMVQRMELREVLKDPKLAAKLTPSMALTEQLLRDKSNLSGVALQTAKSLIQRFVEQLAEVLKKQVQQTVRTKIDRSVPPKRVFRNLDLKRTIWKNLTNWNDKEKRLYVDRLFYHHASKKTLPSRMIVVVDQSGSMVEAMVQCTILASIFAGLPRVEVHLMAFDTEVIDLTPYVHDPFEVLLRTNLGGGTYIHKALVEASEKIVDPANTVLVLISDFYEGGSYEVLLNYIKALKESGVHFIPVGAVTNSGYFSVDSWFRTKLGEMGMPILSGSPKKLIEQLKNLL
ncbi:MAG: VWA domain-containing protein [Myxococcales bacterium]|nr:VWA domain-containing protein [Myxococcales bacterium]